MAHFTLHPRIKTFFENAVNSPFENGDTDAWNTEIRGNDGDWSYHSSLVEKGRSSFYGRVKGLTPKEQITIYCYYYMQMHTASSFHVYRNALRTLKMKFLNNLIFVDFGCGPLTSAIAMAWYNLISNKDKSAALRDGLRLNYIGIDRFKPMVDYAKGMWASADGLFHSDATCDVIRRKDAPLLLPILIQKYRRPSFLSQPTICLNCSYYFGSNSLNVSQLVALLRKTVEQFSKDRLCLVYQNATDTRVNEKWEEFKAGMKDLLLPAYDDTCEEHFYCDVTGRRHQRSWHKIKLRHAVLLNQKWSDHLGRA